MTNPGSLSSRLATPIGRLRLLGMAEGISFLALLGVAMPLKYIAGNPMPVRYTGMVHGLLFIGYTLSVLQVAFDRSWPFTRTLGFLVAAVVPFGPFIADRYLLRADASGSTEG